MKVKWITNAREDYFYSSNNDPKKWINDLIRDIQRDSFKGLGKPEPLKYDLRGCWSRRITLEDRLVYRVSGKGDQQQVEILQCRYHY